MLTVKQTTHATDYPTSMAAVAAALSIAVAAKGQTIYVDDSAPPGGSGGSWESPFHDLQDAFDSMSRFDRWRYITVKLGQGTYKPGRGSNSRMSSFTLDRRTVGSAMSVELRGGYAGYGAPEPDLYSAAFVSVLSGDLKGDDTPNFGHRQDNAQRILDLKGLSNLRMSGITITGANASDAADPVAVNIDPAGLDKSAYFDASTCTFQENDVRAAGALLRVRASYAYMNHCTINNNRANFWDFEQTNIYSDSGPGLGDCTIRNNTGGIIRSNTEAYLGRCWVLSNGSWPDSGSAIVSKTGALGTCFVAGNTSPNTWWSAAGLVRVDQCTIIANSTGGDVSLIKAEGGMSVQDSIVWGNSAGPFGTLGVGGDTYLFAEYSNIEHGRSAVDPRRGSLAWGRGNIDADPQIPNLAGDDGDLSTWNDNNVLLAASSPCIDAGDPQVGQYSGDIFGVVRWVDGNGDSTIAIDIGAVEFLPPACAADVNRDGRVDAEDLWLFWRAFENSDIVTGGITADFNHDGFVTGDDWDEFIAAFVSGC